MQRRWLCIRRVMTQALFVLAMAVMVACVRAVRPVHVRGPRLGRRCAAWGDNAFGQLGDGDNADSGLPLAVRNGANTANLSGVRAIAAGLAAACARCVTAIAPRSSQVEPWSCWWRAAHIAIHWGGTR